MVKLLIIADDFTGALDTGVQFSKLGIQTMVTTNIDENLLMTDEKLEVLVIDTETRYLTFEKAYQKIKKIILSANKAKIAYIYKKVDSALRGNISAEIKAILDNSQKDTLPFLPAYPEMNRVLIDGKLYIDGQLVSESVFADDPYEPVTESDDNSPLNKEAEIEGTLIRGKDIPIYPKGLLLFDSKTELDLENQLLALDKANLLDISIGCAGFAKVLSKHLFNKNASIESTIKKPIVVVSGSINMITQKQIEYAEEKKYPRLSLSTQQLLTPGYWDSQVGKKDIKIFLTLIDKYPLVIFETLSEKTTRELRKLEKISGSSIQEVRFKIGNSLGQLTKALWKDHSQGTFLFTGGDTLFQSMEVLGITKIKPITEISKGVVLSRIDWQEKEIEVITKSGGFGHQELFEDMIKNKT
ncbi:MAG: four-carbon acid sugar kinase family protein [Vagococcus sp.]